MLFLIHFIIFCTFFLLFSYAINCPKNTVQIFNLDAELFINLFLFISYVGLFVFI
jgi:hypothetical protein